jgi:hypothetical protein
VGPKTVYRKIVEENGDDDLLTKQYFPRSQTEERRELLTDLIVVRAVAGERDQQMTRPWKLF